MTPAMKRLTAMTLVRRATPVSDRASGVPARVSSRARRSSSDSGPLHRRGHVLEGAQGPLPCRYRERQHVGHGRELGEHARLATGRLLRQHLVAKHDTEPRRKENESRSAHRPGL